MLDPFAGRCQFGRRRFRIACIIDGSNPAGPNDRRYILARKVISMSPDETANRLTAATLEAKWKSNPDSEQRQNPFNLRMRRALSWLDRAEQERDDPDAAFIFYWIAFNAAYAGNIAGERRAFKVYFGKMLALRDGRVIFNEMSSKFAVAIRKFIPNKYVFPDFWTGDIFQQAAPKDWQPSLYKIINRFDQAIRNNNVRDILEELFDRLYVLRNQLVHGGATWQGSVNRDSVGDGAAIMAFLLPHFINLMLDNPTADWGVPPFAAGTRILPLV